MKIAVINETSCCSRNKDLMQALEGRGHDIINLGMKNQQGEPVLTFIETGFLTGLLLNLGAVDFVVGGCGTGVGYYNMVLQFPGVVCALIEEPLDAWMYIQINAGNCISLPLNKGYGWGSDEKLKHIFDQLLKLDLWAHGYPEHRRESEVETRRQLMAISKANHHDFATLMERMYAVEPGVIDKALAYPGIREFIRSAECTNTELQALILDKYVK